MKNREITIRSVLRHDVGSGAQTQELSSSPSANSSLNRFTHKLSAQSAVDRPRSVAHQAESTHPARRDTAARNTPSAPPCFSMLVAIQCRREACVHWCQRQGHGNGVTSRQSSGRWTFDPFSPPSMILTSPESFCQVAGFVDAVPVCALRDAAHGCKLLS